MFTMLALIPRGGKEMKSYNTSNMRCHLETNYKEKDEFATPIAKEKELVKEKDEMSSTGSSTQPTIIHSLMKSQLFSFEHLRAKGIKMKVGEMIVLDSEPSNIAHHTGFTTLLKVY